MSFSDYNILTWIALIIGGAFVLCLCWGLVKASLKMAVYLALIILIFIFLKTYNLIPPEVNQWLEEKKEQVHEKLQDVLIDQTIKKNETPPTSSEAGAGSGLSHD